MPIFLEVTKLKFTLVTLIGIYEKLVNFINKNQEYCFPNFLYYLYNKSTYVIIYATIKEHKKFNNINQHTELSSWKFISL